MDIKVQHAVSACCGTMHDTLACFCLAMCHCSILKYGMHVLQGVDVFLALSGDWGLGNLGSAVMTGALVQSATQRD